MRLREEDGDMRFREDGEDMRLLEDDDERLDGGDRNVFGLLLLRFLLLMMMMDNYRTQGKQPIFSIRQAGWRSLVI